nr:hypothetical protein [Micromonospora sp. DSM 115978]
MRAPEAATVRTPDEVTVTTAALDEETGSGPRIDVAYLAGESYRIGVRGHEMLVDQPVPQGGRDSAPTPTELFVASLASCVAFYAGRYLDRRSSADAGCWPLSRTARCTTRCITRPR